jgi:hypothetical protein
MCESYLFYERIIDILEDASKRYLNDGKIAARHIPVVQWMRDVSAAERKNPGSSVLVWTVLDAHADRVKDMILSCRISGLSLTHGDDDDDGGDDKSDEYASDEFRKSLCSLLSVILNDRRECVPINDNDNDDGQDHEKEREHRESTAKERNFTGAKTLRYIIEMIRDDIESFALYYVFVKPMISNPGPYLDNRSTCIDNDGHANDRSDTDVAIFDPAPVRSMTATAITTSATVHVPETNRYRSERFQELMPLLKPSNPRQPTPFYTEWLEIMDRMRPPPTSTPISAQNKTTATTEQERAYFYEAMEYLISGTKNASTADAAKTATMRCDRNAARVYEYLEHRSRNIMPALTKFEHEYDVHDLYRVHLASLLTRLLQNHSIRSPSDGLGIPTATLIRNTIHLCAGADGWYMLSMYFKDAFGACTSVDTQ